MKRRRTKGKAAVSHQIALGVLKADAWATGAVLLICLVAVLMRFEGPLPYLTTLIGAMQVVTGYVLGSYFRKSTAENTKGGIVYDAAMSESDLDTRI